MGRSPPTPTMGVVVVCTLEVVSVLIVEVVDVDEPHCDTHPHDSIAQLLAKLIQFLLQRCLLVFLLCTSFMCVFIISTIVALNLHRLHGYSTLCVLQ